ncbi:proline-, glutamic acid- and leucine-rich protein 1 [Condylostylus longicornis]|uniref:proline-, glutamic acid- and leucine-rich protein 1 n=1 Tax=Condylostylus longicornis TaxID=2530218 RepID=UPI00244DB1B6|nr:proline-, glutamic acid- and leucine-rich protein 1 [Condylostylus longicornis]
MDLLKIQHEISECKFFDALYKRSLINHQSFRLSHGKQAEAVYQNIAQKINKQQSQEEGLILLHCFLTQCNLDIIEQKGIMWTTTCLKICSQNRGNSLVSLAYEILGILLEKSCNIPELAKSFSGNYVGKICEMLRLSEPNSYLSTLKCLSICLKNYPGSCGGGSRNLIEQFLIKNFVDSSEQNFVKLSGICLHLLQQVKGGSAFGNSQKVSWKTYQLKLLGSLHNILDLLFINCAEYFDFEKEEYNLDLYPLNLSDEPLSRTGQLTTRFKNLVNYLMIAIRDPFPVSKAIQPRKILNLIARGLHITCDNLKQNLILDNIVLGAVLPDIQLELYKLLSTLILTLKNHLNIYQTQVLSLITDSLKWTSTGKYDGFKKPYSDLRIAIYNTLVIWCQTMKFGSCCELVFEQIFREIENDITPFQNEMMLQVLNDSKRHISKKIRRQLQKTQNERTHLAQLHMSGIKSAQSTYNNEQNQNICFIALTALKYAYIYCSCFVKPLIIKEIQEKIINLCLTLFETRTSKISLYSNSLCREKLYENLSVLVVSPHCLCPPPTSMIIQLLIEGQTNDYCSRVRKCCTDRLIFLEKILHPQKHSLYFPPELNNMKSALEIREQSYDSENDVENISCVFSENLGNQDEILAEPKASTFTSTSPINQTLNDFVKNDKIIDEEENVLLEKENNVEIFVPTDKVQPNASVEECNNSFSENITIDCGQNITENTENILNCDTKAIPCPKKRMLHKHMQKCSEDDELKLDQSDISNFPKRVRIDNDVIENVAVVNSDTELNETSKDKNLLDQILATFTDELNEE